MALPIVQVLMYFAPASLFVLAMVLALSSRLLLTLPLVVIGLGVLALVPIAGPKRKFKYLLVNAGLTLLLSGVAFIVLNLSSTLNHKKSSKRVYVADYGTPKTEGAWVSGPHEPLGYRYKAGLAEIRSKLVEEKTGSVIYDVVYSFEPNGLRKTGRSTRAGLSDKSALFLGGSFTFGEGLGDQDTLPSLFSELTGWKSINAGMHGYGTHQAYETLRNPMLYRAITNSKKVDLVVYRVMDDHVNRAAGKSDWDRYGPCFEVSRDQAVVYQGTFESCKKKPSFVGVARFLLAILMKTKEPVTRSFVDNIETAIFRGHDEKRQLALIAEMHKLSNLRSAKLIVLNETILPPSYDLSNSVSSKCKLSNDMISLGQKLRANGIEVIDSHQLVSRNGCTPGLLAIPRDGHPSRYANTLASKALVRFAS